MVENKCLSGSMKAINTRKFDEGLNFSLKLGIARFFYFALKTIFIVTNMLP